MKTYILFFFLILLAGCCSEAKYKTLLDTRLGLSENDLIEQVGNPSSVYETGEKRSLEYKSSRVSCDQYGCDTLWCDTQYMIKDKKVESWTYRGNYCCIP